MNLFREWLRRAWYLLNRRRFEAALRDEMEAHLAAMEQPPRFGNVLRLREKSRDVWGWSWLDNVWRDVALTMRTLRRSPAFASIAVLTLGLGVGVNLAFFQIVNTLLLQPHPVRDPDTLARFYRRSASGTSSSVPVPLADFVGRHNSVLAATLMSRRVNVAWQRDGFSRVDAAFVSSNWFEDLGASAEVGQLFQHRDAASAAGAPVVVISYDLWQREFRERVDAVGAVVHLNERPAVFSSRV